MSLPFHCSQQTLFLGPEWCQFLISHPASLVGVEFSQTEGEGPSESERCVRPGGLLGQRHGASPGQEGPGSIKQNHLNPIIEMKYCLWEGGVI